MRVSRPLFRRKPKRLRLPGAAALSLAASLSGCAPSGNSDHAPAIGTLGGMAAGALVGSASGSAGTGAVIGGMLGGAGGQIVRSERSPSRAEDDALLLREVPATLKSTGRFDASLEKEYQSLARRRATGGDPLVVKALASQKIREADTWIHLLEASDAALARAIRSETARPTGQLGTWLTRRDQVRARLASLKMHQSWLKPLAS
jgi:hypothetical protein